MSTPEEILEVFVSETSRATASWKEVLDVGGFLYFRTNAARGRAAYFKAKDAEPERKRKNRELKRRAYWAAKGKVPA